MGCRPLGQWPARLDRSPLLALVLAALVPAVAHAAPGAVTLVRAAGNAGSPAEQGFLVSHIWRMHGATAWQSNTWLRRSAYALDTATAAAHPEWVLKDRYGTPAVPRRRSRPPTSATPTYRAWWIAQADRAGRRAARPLHRRRDDDAPRVPAPGARRRRRATRAPSATMTEANWQRYMADFMVAVRAALPGRRDRPRRALAQGRRAARTSRASSPPRRTSRSRRASTTPSSPAARARTACGRSPAFVERRQAAGRGVILDGHADAAAGRLTASPTCSCSTRARSRSATTPGPLRAASGRLRRQPRRAVRAAHAWSGVSAARLRRRRRARQRARHGRAHASRSAPGFADLDGIAVKERDAGRRHRRRARCARCRSTRRRPRPRRRRPVATPDTAVPRSRPRPRRRAGAARPALEQPEGAHRRRRRAQDRPRRPSNVSRLSVSGRVTRRGQRLRPRDRPAQARQGLGRPCAAPSPTSPSAAASRAPSPASRAAPTASSRRFEGTGTARPSRSQYRTRRL